MHSSVHQRPRSAKSVEDIVDRRVSSLSTTSGCSDCTTATLQGAKSYGSSFFSGKGHSNCGKVFNRLIEQDLLKRISKG